MCRVLDAPKRVPTSEVGPGVIKPNDSILTAHEICLKPKVGFHTQMVTRPVQ